MQDLQNHDQITRMCNEMEHVWRELAELKEVVKAQTTAFEKDRKDHSQRIQLLEKGQIKLDGRWKAIKQVLVVAGSLVGIIGGIIGIIILFT